MSRPRITLGKVLLYGGLWFAFWGGAALYMMIDAARYSGCK